MLKLFAHQDVDKIIDSRTDRDDMRYVHLFQPAVPSNFFFSFFAFCNSNSNNAEPPLDLEIEEEDEEAAGSPDEAAPPPIKSRRKLPVAGSAEDLRIPRLNPRKASPPAVDEMGYPTSSEPMEPITDFSWRNFFSSINFLRVMQKICKNKAHRNLLLVQYKSSNILKKALKVPQAELRLYTLKLFKNQVPYCGRKWRQGNMRVITAVYLHCRPELRDDWLAGSDVDAEVEEALPLEQALRALTHWHNVKRYPEEMGADLTVLEEEKDFFVRELERMEWIIEEDVPETEPSIWDGPGGGGVGW